MMGMFKDHRQIKSIRDEGASAIGKLKKSDLKDDSNTSKGVWYLFVTRELGNVKMDGARVFYLLDLIFNEELMKIPKNRVVG